MMHLILPTHVKGPCKSPQEFWDGQIWKLVTKTIRMLFMNKTDMCTFGLLLFLIINCYWIVPSLYCFSFLNTNSIAKG